MTDENQPDEKNRAGDELPPDDPQPDPMEGEDGIEGEGLDGEAAALAESGSTPGDDTVAAARAKAETTPVKAATTSRSTSPGSGSEELPYVDDPASKWWIAIIIAVFGLIFVWAILGGGGLFAGLFDSNEPTSDATAVPSLEASPSPAVSAEPSMGPVVASLEPSAGPTAAATGTPAPTPEPTATAAPTPTPAPTPEPTETPAPTAAPSESPAPSAAASLEPCPSPAASPGADASPTPALPCSTPVPTGGPSATPEA